MYTRPLVWMAIYLILGGIHLIFSWNDETEKVYGNLRSPNRYVFVAGSVVIWLPLFLYHSIQRFQDRRRGADEGSI